MRILVLGAGAVGGYFGGRLVEAGVDVTFLVRPARRAQLAEEGLVVTSMFGDFQVRPATIGPGEVDVPFDLVLLSCKAYDLDSAMDAVAPAVGPESVVLPLLNGLRQIDVLQARFGKQRVLGGVCYIGARIDPQSGAIRHFGDFHRILFGELEGAESPHAAAFAALDSVVAFDIERSADILQPMWDKFAMLAALSSANVLTRGTVGEILEAPSGQDFLLAALAECRDTAAALGHSVTPATLALYGRMFTTRGSPFATSMLRDVIAGRPTEGDHVIGDLARRAEQAGIDAPILRAARACLETYEAKRLRCSSD